MAGMEGSGEWNVFGVIGKDVEGCGDVLVDVFTCEISSKSDDTADWEAASREMVIPLPFSVVESI